MATGLFRSVPQRPTDIHGIVRGLVAKATDGVVTIAPGIARQMLEECNFVGQRKRQPARVVRHVRRICEGQWDADLSIITLALTPDGKLHNVNGQHRLAAFVQSGVPIPTRVIVKPVSTMEEVRRLYACFDEPGSSRSDNEMLIGVGAAASLGLSNKITQALYRAVALLRNDLEPMGPRDSSQEARERDGRLADLAAWRDEAAAYQAIAGTADPDICRSLLTQGVMASALFTLRHQPKVAREFWGGLAKNDGLRRNDPRARLIADFRNRATNTGAIRQRVQRVAVAWNAFIERRDLSIIKCHEGAPIVFKGTPKGGRR